MREVISLQELLSSRSVWRPTYTFPPTQKRSKVANRPTNSSASKIFSCELVFRIIHGNYWISSKSSPMKWCFRLSSTSCVCILDKDLQHQQTCQNWGRWYEGGTWQKDITERKCPQSRQMLTLPTPGTSSPGLGLGMTTFTRFPAQRSLKISYMFIFEGASTYEWILNNNRTAFRFRTYHTSRTLLSYLPKSPDIPHHLSVHLLYKPAQERMLLVDSIPVQCNLTTNY